MVWGSVTQHLLELRARCLLVVAVWSVLWVVGWLTHPRLLDWIVAPWCAQQAVAIGAPNATAGQPCGLTTITLTGGLWARLWAAGIPAVLGGIPMAIWQGWSFCLGGTEWVRQSRARAWVGWGLLLLWVVSIALTGVFAHPVFTVLVRLGEPWVVPLVTLDGVLRALAGLFIAVLGLLLIPVVIGAGVYARFITPDDLGRARRLIVVGALVVAALITPTTDPVTMVLVALWPLLWIEVIRIGAIVVLRFAGDRAQR